MKELKILRVNVGRDRNTLKVGFRFIGGSYNIPRIELAHLLSKHKDIGILMNYRKHASKIKPQQIVNKLLKINPKLNIRLIYEKPINDYLINKYGKDDKQWYL
jgi:hypothetical protein